ncbi:MAG: YbaK/EbsC family protein [candidate division NC10 bacterium]|nr:YbaK/EbsC family protein [candidate division NC10 bacterium]
MKEAARRVQEALNQYRLGLQVREFAESTKTSQEAADAVGCSVAQIVKSLLFLVDERHYLVLTSGANRVDAAKLNALTGGGKVRLADAETVRRVTGYAIGGVPPIGHKEEIPTLSDETLMRFEVVYAAAGTPNAVFPISPQDLQRITKGRVAAVAQ